MITADQLTRFCPGILPGIVQAFVNHAADITAAEITTPLRNQHFLAQTATESQGFTRLEENLFYRAQRLMQVWPGRFPTMASTVGFAGNPQALANKVYGGRLGNTQPNDGWDYRGSGLLQTTGRSNFAAAGHEDDPDTLRQPDGALLSALKFWTDNGLNAIADTNSLNAVTLKVNGGLNGIADRQAYLVRAKRIFIA